MATPPARITIFRMRLDPPEGPRDRDDIGPQGISLSLRAAVFKGFASATAPQIMLGSGNKHANYVREALEQRQHLPPGGLLQLRKIHAKS
jgi:hypothetical protein